MISDSGIFAFLPIFMSNSCLKLRKCCILVKINKHIKLINEICNGYIGQRILLLLRSFNLIQLIIIVHSQINLCSIIILQGSKAHFGETVLCNTQTLPWVFLYFVFCVVSIMVVLVRLICVITLYKWYQNNKPHFLFSKLNFSASDIKTIARFYLILKL